MIKTLYIKNYLIVDEIEINLNPHLNIITGETGSGKSLIIGALGLCLGNRSESKLFKNNKDLCIIETSFYIKNIETGLSEFLKKNEIDKSNEIVLRREIKPNGNSRCFINQMLVSTSDLKKISSYFIDIHSQHETQSLRLKSYPYMFLNSFDNKNSLLNEYNTKYLNYKILKKKCEDLVNNYNKIIDERSFLEHQLKDFEKITSTNVKDYEEKRKMVENHQNSSQIIETFSEINRSLDFSENSFISIISKFIKKLEKLNTNDENIDIIINKLSELRENSSLVVSNIEDVVDNYNYSNFDIEKASEVVDTVFKLKLKFNIAEVKELLDKKEEVENNIIHLDEQISNKDIYIEKLKNVEQKLYKIASFISENRKKLSKKIEEEVSHIIKFLKLENSEVKFLFEKNEFLNSNGIDNIKIVLKTNKGIEASDISKVASGGELSRIMLAIKQVLSKKKQIPSIIFDEIDSGVSGDVSNKVGSVLRQISEHSQIICITHSPQIASFANCHFDISKNNIKNKTITEIKQLSKKERIHNIAKMISSEKITENSIKTAKELLKINNKL